MLGLVWSWAVLFGSLWVGRKGSRIGSYFLEGTDTSILALRLVLLYHSQFQTSVFPALRELLKLIRYLSYIITTLDFFHRMMAIGGAG